MMNEANLGSAAKKQPEQLRTGIAIPKRTRNCKN
jgi:hypothetical protein